MASARDEASNPSPRLHHARHAPRPSVDTNASGIAESTISFSQFPPPPTEIPLTPVRTGFSTSSPSRPNFSPVQPLVPRKGRLSSKSQGNVLEASSSRSIQSSTRDRNGSIASQATATAAQQQPHHRNGTSSPSISPYDWHDGSSSIDNIDPAESRLLPTSFITSLLQENKDLRRANRKSFASDAFSGISELTYPPPAPYHEPSSRPPIHGRHGKPTRPHGASRAPPSAFNPIHEHTNRMSSDSETLHSTQGYPPNQRENEASRQGPVVVGVAQATLVRNIGGNARPPSSQTVPTSIDEKYAKYGLANQDMDDDSILQFKAANEGYHNESHSQPDPCPQPQTARRRPNTNPQPSPQARQSTYSLAPSFVSRISIPASVRRLLNWKRKPLPPVPRIPDIPIAVERQTRKAEESKPLPDLANRAHALHTLLEKGHHPHHSLNSPSRFVESVYDHEPSSPTFNFNQLDSVNTVNSRQPLRPQYYSDFAKPRHDDQPSLTFSNQVPPRASCIPPLRRRTKAAIAIICTAVIAGIIAAVVVVKRNKSGPTTCSEGLTGDACNLVSTCVCPSEPRCLNPLAQSVLDLIPTVNEAFSGSFTANDVYNSLWYTQGSVLRNDCSPQALLVDVGNGLDDQTYPNRTRWARAALLWNVVQGQDLEVSQTMKDFVRRAPWSTISVDGPTNVKEDSFIGTFSGYTFDFAAQTVTFPTASFVSQGEPTKEQISRVGSAAHSALDRVYTFAQAASIQQETALENYWTTTLSQKSDDLAKFRALLSVAPILLPFDASATSIRNLFSNSSTSLFPPPLACYPGLSNQQRERINSLESSVFQLPASTSPSNFSTECYSDRPVYGILDIFQLRLPYLDSRTGLPRQAAILRRDAIPRTVLYTGEMLSSTFPDTALPTSNSSQLDTRQFGTLKFSNHVLLRYLTSLPAKTATALVEFVLNSASRSPIPPNNSTPLLDALSRIPVLEVAVFGSIGPSDVSGTVSSFTTSSGSMIFGSAAGLALRRWSISTYGGAVQWAENTTSPMIVKDNTFDDEIFNDTWQATAASLQANGSGILRSLVSSFESTGKFTSS